MTNKNTGKIPTKNSDKRAAIEDEAIAAGLMTGPSSTGEATENLEDTTQLRGGLHVPGVMTVKELRDILRTMDPYEIVVLSSDPEGNQFRPLAADGISHNFYAQTNPYIGGTIFERRLQGESMEDFWKRRKEMPKDSRSCITLWPA